MLSSELYPLIQTWMQALPASTPMHSASLNALAHHVLLSQAIGLVHPRLDLGLNGQAFQTDLLSRGFASSSRPAETLKSPRISITMIAMGGRNHHHMPSRRAEKKMAQ